MDSYDMTKRFSQETKVCKLLFCVYVVACAFEIPEQAVFTTDAYS